MKILTLDVSSTCTGYAVGMVLDGQISRGWSPTMTPKLIGGGLIVPDDRKDPPLIRISTMVIHVHAIMVAHPGVTTIVMEIPSGKVHRRLRRPSGGPIYGMAVGAVWWALHQTYQPLPIVTTPDNEWTKGVRKHKRAETVALEYPQVAEQLRTHDPGHDMADAIGLLLWYCRQHRALADS